MAKSLRDVKPEEWFGCRYPGEMMVWLRTGTSGRKLRLFACAACQQVWHEMSESGREMVEAAERWADAGISRKELESIRTRCEVLLPRNEFGSLTFPDMAALSTATPRKDALRDLLRDVAVGKVGQFDGEGLQRVHDHHVRLLHDIFDVLFLSVAVEEGWLTDSVLSVAHSAYEDKDFDLLPILADALEDAGCSDVRLFDHCRGPGPHVRGCWVIDLLLGKE